MNFVSYDGTPHCRSVVRFSPSVSFSSLLSVFTVLITCANVGCGRLGFEPTERDSGSVESEDAGSDSVTLSDSGVDSRVAQRIDSAVPVDAGSATNTGTDANTSTTADAEVIKDSSIDVVDELMDDASIRDAREDSEEGDSAFVDSSDAPYDAGAGCIEDCTSIALDCRSGPCDCVRDSICSIDCSTNACAQIRCENEATCNADCSESNCNTFDCEANSKCNIVCNDALCNGVITCGNSAECSLDCRNGSCHDVICQDGSLCDIQCASSAICKDVRCLAGSTCNFDCRNGSCTEIQCAAGATCNFECNSATCDVACEPDADCSCLSGTSLECDAVCNGEESPCTN